MELNNTIAKPLYKQLEDQKRLTPENVKQAAVFQQKMS